MPGEGGIKVSSVMYKGMLWQHSHFYILLNKATYECSFANSSPIFTIYDIVDRSHNFSCHGNSFWQENMCYHSYQNVYIIKLLGAG